MRSTRANNQAFGHPVDEFTRAFLAAHSQISRPNPLGVCEISPLHRILAPAHVVACREGPDAVQYPATPSVTTKGRPKKNFEEKMASDLTFVDFSNSEMALIVGCNERMLRNRLSKPLVKRRAERRKWIREQQNAAAKKGNATVRIRLGNQQLHQVHKKLSEQSSAYPDAMDVASAEYDRANPLTPGPIEECPALLQQPLPGPATVLEPSTRNVPLCC